MSEPKEPKPSLANSVKGPQPGLRYKPMSFTPPEPLPAFIDVPRSMVARAQYRSMPFTDIPRDVFKKGGVIDLKKMPTRGSDGYGRMLAVWEWLRDEHTNGDWPALDEHYEEIRRAVSGAMPWPPKVRNMEKYVTWVREESEAKFAERLKQIDGLGEADIEKLVDGYRALIPTIVERVEHLAAHFVAEEFMKPHMNNLDKSR